MLRKRSRGVSSKQGLMSDNSSLPSPTGKYKLPTPSLFPSPRLFVGFSGKGVSDSEAAMSPTSILETKPFSALGNPFFTSRNTRKPLPETTVSSDSRHHPWENGDSKAIGLGIVDSLNDDKPDKQSSKPESRMVLLGSQLKIQIPPIIPISISPTGSIESPHSPIEFGIKTKNFHMGSLSSARRSPIGSTSSSGSDHLASPRRVFTGNLSASEMEQSEDYTCVISHVGPNPRTTHIFDNYIVESYSNGSRKENRFLADRPEYPSDKFLSYCYACKKDLGEGKDIYMYRGEKAFCSHECRYQEMLFDEGTEKCSSDPSAIF